MCNSFILLFRSFELYSSQNTNIFCTRFEIFKPSLILFRSFLLYLS